MTVRADGTETPFHLCEAAAKALANASLSPLEWFNLAGLHTPGEYLLSAELYDTDGTALQPRKKVRADNKAPTLEDVRGDLDRLVEYGFARIPDEAMLQALRQFPVQKALSAITQRIEFFAESPFVESAALSLGAATFKQDAAAWVRGLWKTRGPENVRAYALAFAAALPPEEAFTTLTGALEHLPPKALRAETFALARLRSPAALDWLETYVTSPLTWEWGALAAVSQFSWQRACAWLDAGRPLSLIALDALLDTRGPSQDRMPWMNEIQPRLINAPSAAAARRKLESYAAKDPVPRVHKAVNAILSFWPEIIR
ncbi:MAG: hypothetical protein ACT4TC_17135 [Myxococcaceae bacterium]